MTTTRATAVTPQLQRHGTSTAAPTVTFNDPTEGLPTLKASEQRQYDKLSAEAKETILFLLAEGPYMVALSRLVSLGQFLMQHNCNDGNHCRRSCRVTNFGTKRKPGR